MFLLGLKNFCFVNKKEWKEPVYTIFMLMFYSKNYFRKIKFILILLIFFIIYCYAISFSKKISCEDVGASSGNYYDVDEASDLAAAYDKIAKELANLHIKN